MSSYHCYNEAEQDVEKQYRISFPEDAIGYSEFRDLLERLGMLIEPSDQDPLTALRQLHQNVHWTRPRCPRLFVSHRQIDKLEALRVAWLANQHGFDYWLDILDSPCTAFVGK